MSSMSKPAFGGHARFEQVFKYAERVVYPVVFFILFFNVVDIDVNFFACSDACEAKFVVVALGEGSHYDFIGGNSHSKAAVVVGMVSDKFDSSGGLCENFGGFAVYFFKIGGRVWISYFYDLAFR